MVVLVQVATLMKARRPARGSHDSSVKNKKDGMNILSKVKALNGGNSCISTLSLSSDKVDNVHSLTTELIESGQCSYSNYGTYTHYLTSIILTTELILTTGLIFF